MGYGDFKLLAAIGCMVWLANITSGHFTCHRVLGTIIGVGLIILAKRGREVPMPFWTIFSFRWHSGAVFWAAIGQLLH